MTRLPGSEAESDGEDAERISMDGLYRQYGPALRAFLARKGLGREDVADVIQETYYRIHQSGTIDEIEHPKSYLFRVANNLRLNLWRHRRISVEENALEISEVEIESDDPGPYRGIKGQQELAIVCSALEELAPKCRQAFVMNRFENMTFAEIAAVFDVSVSMVEKHISRAIAHIRKRLHAARPPLRHVRTNGGWPDGRT
jgi:RNA polymerase sigma-70 factor (ECF subfamily)